MALNAITLSVEKDSSDAPISKYNALLTIRTITTPTNTPTPGNFHYVIERKAGAGPWKIITLSGFQEVFGVVMRGTDNLLSVSQTYLYRVHTTEYPAVYSPDISLGKTNPSFILLSPVSAVSTDLTHWSQKMEINSNSTNPTSLTYVTERKAAGGSYATVALSWALEAGRLVATNTGLLKNTPYTYRVHVSQAPSVYSNELQVKLDSVTGVAFDSILTFSNPQPCLMPATAVDSDDSVFLGGWFKGSMPVPGSTAATGTGDAIGLLIKYNSSGTFQWKKVFGGTSPVTEIHSLAVDASDNLLVTGRAQFGTVVVDSTTLQAPGGGQTFTIKFNGSTGAVMWAKITAGGSAIPDIGNTIVVDSSGNAVVAIQFQGTVDFGGTVLTATAPSKDVALIKYATADGAIVWAKKYGGASDDVVRALAVDKDDNVIVTGYFTGSTNLGGSTLTAPGGSFDQDIFMAKYNSSGNHVWSKRFGNTGGDLGTGVTTDPVTGNVILTGRFRKAVDFGNGNFVDSYNDGGIFLVGFDPNGNFLWGKATGGGSTSDGGKSVVCDSSGNLVLTGISAAGIYFGGSQLLLSNGQPNLFAARFKINSSAPNAEPAYVAARVLGQGQSGISQGQSVSLDSTGKIIIGGSWTETIDFGDGVARATYPAYSGGILVKYA